LYSNSAVQRGRRIDSALGVTMHNVVGPPVRGDDFFDRESEQRQMWRSLERHHVLLLAPRRVGKTSLMYRLAEQAPANGFRAIYESAVKCETELALVSQLYKAVALQDESVAAALTGGRLGRLVERVKGLKGLGVELVLKEMAPEDWVPLGEELILALRGSGQRWLLLLDELPVFVVRLLEQENGRARVRRLLDWMRDARQGTFRWLLAGSIGLDAVTQRLGLGASINDLLVLRLGPPRDAQARDLLSACARDPEGASRTVLEQALGRHIQDPATRSGDLAWLLSVLENDGYIVPVDGRHRFRSPLLQSYWRGRAP
jgi:hypothetical protein